MGVWLSYWGVIAFRDHVQSATHSFFELTRTWIRRILEAGIERGEIRSSINEEAVVDQIMALCDGISVRATLDKRTWPAKRQKEFVANYIAMLRK